MTNSVKFVVRGADPSGTKDSTAAIQAAVDAAAQHGGTVVLPPGTYRVATLMGTEGVASEQQDSQ